MNDKSDFPSSITLPDFDGLSKDIAANIEDIFEVHSVRHRRAESMPGPFVANGGVVLDFLGWLRVPSEQAYQLVASYLRDRGYIALFRKSADQDVITAVPGELPTASPRVGLALIMFLLTLLSVLWIGAEQEQSLDSLSGLLSGWPFAASLLGILLAHEFGHYLVSRHYGVSTSLPYFIPMPLSLLGTLGAVIQMKAPPKNRRQLLAIGAAGPLAGFAVALPLLIVGLHLSEIQSVPVGIPFVQEGNSLLYAGLKILLFGRFLPAGGEDVFLHPVAMAAWTGLLVTGLNLIPAGQLDGGHIAYALLGDRARSLTWAIIAVLVGLSFLWNGWLVWAALIFVFGRRHAIPLDDITQLRTRERVFVALLLAIWILVFTPIPITIG